MTISDACEIQFWPTGTESFNEKTEAFTDEDWCFNQKFLCSSQRKFQGIGIDADQDYYLIAFDQDEVELFNSAFTKENIYTTDAELAFANETFTSNITGWTNYNEASKKSWVWGVIGPFGCAVSVGATEPDSQQLYAVRGTNGIGSFSKFPPGTYRFRLNASNGSSGGSAPLTESLVIRAFDTPGGANEVNYLSSIARGGGFADYEIELTTTQEWTYFSFAWEKDGTKTSSVIDVYVNTIEIIEYPIDYTKTIYSLSMTPSDEGMCNKLVQFKIFDGADPDLDNEIHHSDFIDFVSVWSSTPSSGRVVIQYTNSKPFAGLYYDGSMSYFNLEIEGKFSENDDREITAQKAIELSESILNTAASVKIQRELIIDDVPSYMHKKICLALAHAGSGSVLINGIEWTLEEAYNKSTDMPKSYPFRPASVFLTEKNSYQHNII